jgi:hypothetical protein
MKRWLASIAAAVALQMAGGGVFAQSAGMIRATCTAGGTTVYREDIPADASAEQRLAIASRNPEAMCVFLKISDLPPERRVASPTSMPEDIFGGSTSTGEAPDASLAAALSVLSGQDFPSVMGSAPAFSNSYSRPVASAAPERPKPLNLTIGIYKGIPMEDVMAHWKDMQADTRILSRMTPSMSIVGDVTMLSVENVQDSEAAALCEEAGLKGAGCIAVY